MTRLVSSIKQDFRSITVFCFRVTGQLLLHFVIGAGWLRQPAAECVTGPALRVGRQKLVFWMLVLNITQCFMVFDICKTHRRVIIHHL